MKRSVKIALVQGYDAHAAGESEDDNPYPHGSKRRTAWERGWHRRQLALPRRIRTDKGTPPRGPHGR